MPNNTTGGSPANDNSSKNERERVRSGDDRNQKLERERVPSRHDRGDDEAARGGTSGDTDPDSAESEVDRDDMMDE